MRWDIFAAVVAFAGIPLMLSSATIWFLKLIFQRTMRIMFSHGSTCERLQWEDIPSGPLGAPRDRTALPPRGNYSGAKRETFAHDEENCFASTVGRVFKNAWISSQRRDIRVSKPYQLDPRKAYIRTDPKTLRVCALISHEALSENYEQNPVITFNEIDGVLTAHLSASMTRLPEVTKAEIEAILDGYPPFHLEKIPTSRTDQASTPISSSDDITRGGWIVAIGIDYYKSAPLWTHNMAPSKIHDKHFSHVEKQFQTAAPWRTTAMASAVKRFGHALDNIERVFPDTSFAKSFYTALINDQHDLDRTSPMGVLRNCPQLSDETLYTSLPFWIDRPYIKSLSSEQWQIAMQAFNHYEPLSEDEQSLFREFMQPILQAAFVGLINVMTYGNHYSHRQSLSVWSLPAFPELKGHKYAYLRACEAEKD